MPANQYLCNVETPLNTIVMPKPLPLMIRMVVLAAGISLQGAVACAMSVSATDTAASRKTIHITSAGQVVLAAPGAGKTASAAPVIWNVRPSRVWTTTDIQRRVLNVESILPGPAHKPDIIPYTGRGVVVGIIDCGIDPGHVAFLNTDRTASRVARFIVTKSAEETGDTLTAAVYDGDSVAMAPVNTDGGGHGTHTSSTAGGSFGRGQAEAYSGMAPEATMVLVDIGELMYDDEIIHGMRAVADYASAHGKRAVMNLSLGSNLGPHDGTSPIGLVSAEVGRRGVFSCFSAGNDGLSAMSLQRDFSVDSIPLGALFYKWDRGSVETCAMDAWSMDSKELEVSVIVAQMWPPQILWRSPYFTLGQAQAAGGTLTLLGGPDPLCPPIGELIAPGSVDLEMGIYPLNGRFYASLRGELMNWTQGRKVLGFLIRSPQGADVRVYTEPAYCTFGTSGIKELTAASSSESISDMCDAYGVVSVGSTNARAGYTTLDGTRHTLDEEVLGALNSPSLTSSYGTGFNTSRYVLPHILAPGVHVMAALNGRVENIEKKAVAAESYQGQRYLWGEFSGTSMSSPAAAGAIALWLEAFPTLTYEQLMQTLQASSDRSWLADHPERAAWGQIDAYEGLKYIFRTFSVGENIVDGGDDFRLIARYMDRNVLEITSSRPLTDAVLNVHGADGRLVQCSRIHDRTFTVTLPADGGMYVLTVTDAHGRAVMKAVV